MIIVNLELWQKAIQAILKSGDGELSIQLPLVDASSELAIALITGVELSDNALVFNDDEAKAVFCAGLLYDVASADTDNLFRHDVVSLSLAHQSQWKTTIVANYVYKISSTFDIFETAEIFIKNRPNHTFEVMHFLTGIKEHVQKFKWESLVSLVSYFYNNHSHDLAFGSIIHGLSGYILNDHEKYDLFCSYYEKNRDEPIIPLYNTVLINRAKSDSTIELKIKEILSAEKEIDANYIYLYGRILEILGECAEDKFNILIAYSKSDSIDFRNAAISALSFHIAKNETVDDFFRELLISKNDHAIISIAARLFTNYNQWTEHKDFDLWIESLAYTTNVRDYRDDIYSRLVNTRLELVVNALEEAFLFYVSNDILFDIEHVFKSTLHKLQKHDEFIDVIFKWLNSPNYLFASLAHQCVQHYQNKNVLIDENNIQNLKLTTLNDLSFFINKVIGYIDRVEILVPICIALISKFHNSDFLTPCLELLQFVYFDYPTETNESIKSALTVEDSAFKKAEVEDFLRNIDSYFNAIRDIPVLTELTPKRQAAVAFTRAFNQSLSNSFNAANEKSVMTEIFGEGIPLKAGGSFMLPHDNSFTSVDLSSYTSSISLPRTLVLDPIGYEILRMQARLATRNKE